MNDRERILTQIIARLQSTMLLDHKVNGLYVDYEGNPGTQFVGTYLVKPKPGDIVQCNTQFEARWKYAFFLEDCGGDRGGYWLLREIGGKATVRMFNESISVLIGISPTLLHEGHQHQLYVWAQRAFSTRYNPKADHFTKFGGADFTGDTLRVWVRSHIWITEKEVDGKTLYPQPWFVELKWSNKTRLKDIVAALLAAGFPREWEYADTEPDRGPKKITAETLRGVLNNVGISSSPVAPVPIQQP